MALAVPIFSEGFGLTHHTNGKVVVDDVEGDLFGDDTPATLHFVQMVGAVTTG